MERLPDTRARKKPRVAMAPPPSSTGSRHGPRRTPWRFAVTTMAGLKHIWHLFRDSAIAWNRDNIAQRGAALSYFTVFALTPLLILLTVVSSLGFGREAASGRLVGQIRGLIGVDGAIFVQSLIKNAYRSDGSLSATIFSVAMLLFGASAVFVELRDSLNDIWRVRQKPTGSIHAFLRARILAFAIILGLGFLALVSLVLSSLLAATSGYLGGMLDMFSGILTLLDVVVSFLGITVMFGLMYKYVSAAVIQWKDVWIGAGVTSFLFALGKEAIGLYLGNGAIGTTFGAASSLVIIMLWTYYSTQIILFGAEFTYLYASRFGSKIVPKPGGSSVAICDDLVLKASTTGRRSVE